MSSRERATPQMTSRDILEYLHHTPGYFVTNNERDVSQSDFKGRIMPHTTLKVAPYRDDTGFFAMEITGGATVHVDLLRKQMSKFLDWEDAHVGFDKAIAGVPIDQRHHALCQVGVCTSCRPRSR